MAQVYNANTLVDLFLSPLTQISNSLTSVQTLQSSPLPTGWDYQYLVLELSPTTLTAAMVTEVRLYANGNQFFKMAGADIDKMNQYMDMPAANAYQTYNATNYLVIPLTRVNVKSGTQFANTSFATKGMAFSEKDLSTACSVNTGSNDASGQGINSFELQVDFNGTPASGTLLCNLRAGVYNAFPGGPGLIPYVDKLIFNAVAGSNTGTQQNMVNYGNIQHSFMDYHVMIPASGAGTLATTSPFDWTLNGSRQYYRYGDEQSMLNARSGNRTPQAGYYILDNTAVWGDEFWPLADPSTSVQVQFQSTVNQSITVYERCSGLPWAPPVAAS